MHETTVHETTVETTIVPVPTPRDSLTTILRRARQWGHSTLKPK